MKLVQRIVPDSSTHQLRDVTVAATLILHTNGAKNSVGSLYEYILNSKTRIYPHFQCASDGTIEQYCPLDRQAYVQYDGNRYAFSVETQDSGYNSTPIDRDPWTDAQLRALATLAVELNVPARACTTTTSGGIGYHSQFRDAWNKSGHNCPGFARREQIARIIELMAPPIVIAGVPPPPLQEDEDVPYLMLSLKGYQNIVAAFANGAVRQMPLAEYLFLRDVGKVPTVEESTPDGIDRILMLANMDHSELVKA